MPLIRTNPVGEASSSSAQSTRKLLVVTTDNQDIGFSDPIPVQGLPTIACTFRMLSTIHGVVNENYDVLCTLQGAIEQNPYSAFDSLNWFNLTNTSIMVTGARVTYRTGFRTQVEQTVTTTHALAFIRIRIFQIDKPNPSTDNVTVECQLSISQ